MALLQDDEPVPATTTLVGTRVLRIEDDPLLRGQGRFIANLDLPDAAHVVFVRATLAHARIVAIDTASARTAPGVLDVVTAADIDLAPLAAPAGMHEAMVRPLLPDERVRYVGEPVVAVVARTVAEAVDAAELVDIDYDPLPIVADAATSLVDDVLLHPEAGTNVSFDSRVDIPPDHFTGCEVIVDATFVNTRQAPVPLETRVGAARWGGEHGDELTVWASCQRAHPPRELLCLVYGLPPGKVRVIVPDVGGSFGAKHAGTPEELLLPLLARRTGRPVRFVETRTDNLVNLNHGRGQIQHVRLGGTRDGRFRALAVHVVRDAGAYPAIGSTTRMTRVLAPGCYAIDRVHYSAVAPVTNTAPSGSFRGAGRPEAAAAIERAVDLYAAEIAMAPDELRRKNFVRTFPHANGMGVAYDSGDYPEALQRALAAADVEHWRAEQARRRAAGEPVLVGIGLSSYVEIANPLGAGEYGRVELTPDGRLQCFTGSSPHGQGTHTALAMLAADATGIALADITVEHGDTAVVPRGNGTGGSRSLQTGGSAMLLASRRLVDDARRIAADLLEARADDVVLDHTNGRFHVIGTPAIGCTWADIAHAAGPAGLWAEDDFGPTQPTFPFGAHVAVVEVDTETGGVRLVRFVALDDCGVIVNPVLVEGQVHGGIASGVAQALYEEVRYDADANPLATNLADYACISATELPSFDLVEMITPTTANPIGAKGVGESGTTGSVPAVQNAVIDALAHLGVRHLDVPLTPEKVWRAITSG